MKNRQTILVIILILVILGGAFYLYMQNSGSESDVNNSNTTSTTATSSSSSQNSVTQNSKTETTADTRVQFTDEGKYTFGFESLRDGTTFTSSSTNTSITFTLLNDASHQSVNSTYAVSLNNNVIGQISGEQQSIVGFSPDTKYFALRTSSNLGCNGICQGYEIYVININAKTISEVAPPQSENIYESYGKTYGNGISFIGPLTWTTSDDIQLASIVVGIDSTSGKLYALTPETIFTYNPVTKTYSKT